jgi:hypothetical protein
VPDGDIRDLLTRAGNAFLCRPDDVSEMTKIISEQMSLKDAGVPAPETSEDVLQTYERKHLTRELIEVFEKVTRGSVSRPQTASLPK